MKYFHADYGNSDRHLSDQTRARKFTKAGGIAEYACVGHIFVVYTVIAMVHMIYIMMKSYIY